jgi:hypothetical protein
MSIHAYKATTCCWASRQQQEQQAYIHFLISLYMKKAARNTGTQHPIFWTKKISDMLGWSWIIIIARRIYLPTISKPSFQKGFCKSWSNICVKKNGYGISSSFFFCAKSIKHVWGVGIKKTTAMENHQTSYKCVHIYMSLQNYCKWSGIYFCSVVCFEKTNHIAALGFWWWLDCHDLCWCCAQVVVVVCGKLYCSWTWGCGAGESVSSTVWTWSGRAASICESLISSPPVSVYGKSLLNQKTPFWIVSAWHSGELIARFYILLLPWKKL